MADIHGEKADPKGWIHSYTGVPAMTWLRGNSDEYRLTEQYIADAGEGRTRLLQSHAGGVKQCQEISRTVSVLEVNVNQNTLDVQAARRTREEAVQNLDAVHLTAPWSLVPRIPTVGELAMKPLAFVPVLGTLITGCQTVAYHRRRTEAEERVSTSERTLGAFEAIGEDLSKRTAELSAQHERALKLAQADLRIATLQAEAIGKAKAKLDRL